MVGSSTPNCVIKKRALENMFEERGLIIILPVQSRKYSKIQNSAICWHDNVTNMLGKIINTTNKQFRFEEREYIEKYISSRYRHGNTNKNNRSQIKTFNNFHSFVL